MASGPEHEHGQQRRDVAQPRPSHRPYQEIWQARAHTCEGHGGDRYYVLIEAGNPAWIKERLAEMLKNDVHPIPANLTRS